MIGNVRVASNEDVLLLCFPPAFLAKDALIFRDSLAGLIERRGSFRLIVLDFARTELIDSSGIGALIINLKVALSRSIAVQAWSVGPQVRLALSLVGVDQLIPIVAGTEAVNPDAPRRPVLLRRQLHRSVQSRTKRLLDLIAGTAGLLLALVLLPWIALVIRLDSAGPVFVGSDRLGLMGRRVRLWRLRVTRPGSAPLDASDPARFTRISCWLERTGLADLPMFWNVLAGEISLVGVYPPTPAQADHYSVSSWQRLDMKPGMVGVLSTSVQLLAPEGAEAERLELAYQQHWSIAADLRLLARGLGAAAGKLFSRAA